MITTESKLDNVLNRLINNDLPYESRRIIRSFFSEIEGKQVLQILLEEVNRGLRFTPPIHTIFTALRFCPLDQTRVFILGSRPYAGFGLETGIPFSRNLDVSISRLPPLLAHILNGLPYSNTMPVYQQADLSRWAEQGVLLLPEGFTTGLGEPRRSHRALWEPLFLRILDRVLSYKHSICVLLLGEEGLYYEPLIPTRHRIFYAPQPRTSLAQKLLYWPGIQQLAAINQTLIETGSQPVLW